MSITIAPKRNPAWGRFHPERRVTEVRRPLFGPDARFFLMGSCFAEEIRLALEDALGPGRVGPNYAALAFDPARAQVDELPHRNHLNTYNAASVLQEIERILGLWTPEPDDWWEVNGQLQCPYRRLVFADSPETFAAVTAGLDRILRDGFTAAEHFVFTFGMTELFVNQRSGKVASQKPGYGRGGGKHETRYVRASFAECKATILRIADLIGEAKPQARLFMTVSPVPLKRTWSGEDIFVANARSKATLRAALAEAADERENIVYFPSYDVVLAEGLGAFEDDGRHVRRALVEEITRGFVATFLDDGSARQAAE